PAYETGNLSVLAARTDLPATVGAHLASGAWLNQATARYPAVVLGAMAAKRLGVPRASPRTQVWLGGPWFTLVGVLHPLRPAPPRAGPRRPGRLPRSHPPPAVRRIPPPRVPPHPRRRRRRGASHPRRDRHPRTPQRGGRVPPLRRAHRQTGHRHDTDRAAA